MIRHAFVLLAIVAAPAQAQMCDGVNVAISSDGRALGHLPYGDVAEGELVGVPAGLSLNGCRVRRDTLPDLQRLLAAAAGDPAVGGRILALSCHRSISRQSATFCRTKQTASGLDRAISVAPPGHSEHATGYALDFAVRPANGCPDAEACMAATPAFRWLVENAPRYGFEMSFPTSNTQNVKWEPWHWRWVGRSSSAPGAARARTLFARARARFPADPQIVAPPRVVRTIAPVYIRLPVLERDKKRRRK